MANYHGKTALIGTDMLSDAQTLPDSTSVDSTNMVYVGANARGEATIFVYANTDITIATGQAFNIELQAYTSDTAASAVSPIENAHVYLLHKTSADAELSFDAGDLICAYPVPYLMLGENSYDWIQLVYTTDASEVTEKVDAFVAVTD